MCCRPMAGGFGRRSPAIPMPSCYFCDGAAAAFAARTATVGGTPPPWRGAGTAPRAPLAGDVCRAAMGNAAIDFRNVVVSPSIGGGAIFRRTDFSSFVTSRWDCSIPATCCLARGSVFLNADSWREFLAARAICSSWFPHQMRARKRNLAASRRALRTLLSMRRRALARSVQRQGGGECSRSCPPLRRARSAQE